VVGLGEFGFLHARAYRENPRVELAALCDVRKKRLEAVGKLLGVGRLYEDYAEMFEAEKKRIDIVSVATPDESHADVAGAALRIGKNVFVEKPMCRTLDEADRIVNEASRSRGMLMVDFILRFDPRYIKARETVKAGELGRIIALHARRHASSEFARTHGKFSNLFRSSAVHDIDAIIWMTSAKPVRVYAIGNGSISNKGFDDAILCLLEFEGGTIASIDANWVLPREAPSNLESELRIVGAKGVVDVVANDQGLAKVTAGERLVTPDLSFWPVIEERVEGSLKRAIDHFVSCVIEGNQPSVGPVEGRDALKIALALEESATTHTPVSIGW
jgi:UDP-N-acetylglucosamine 3-dehydrogenase